MAEFPKHKIVIVEDEGLIAADLEQRLKLAGYAVPGTADSAPEALQLVRKTSPDLVLMDIRLKGNVDGIEVADQIRRQLDIPVVYLTAYEDAGTLKRAGLSQAFGYVRKPVASAGLNGAIEIALAKHRYERELRVHRDWAIASFASVPDAVFVTDKQGRITYLNAHAEVLTGLPSDQALGLYCWESLGLFYRESAQPVQDLISVAMLNGEAIFLGRGICQRRAARTLVISGTVAPRWHGGIIEGAVITLSDVTGQEFDRDQIQQSNKQKALQRLTEGLVRKLGEAAQISTENNPFVENTPDDLSQIIARFSRVFEAPDLRSERVDVRRMLRTIQTACTRIQLRLEMVFEIESAEVEADPWHFTRTLISVLLHAQSCRKDDGFVSVALSGAELESLSGAVRIRISYQTNEGPSAIEQIFEPDFTGCSHDLHDAYQVIQKMGGMLAAHLERGDQAVIDVYFPRVHIAAAGVQIPEAHKPAVLLVDSNPEVRRVLNAHFEQNGCNLLAIAGCEEALLLAQLYPGAIPLVIANLPREHAARDCFSRQLEGVRPSAEIRLLSGYSEPRRAVAGEPLQSGGRQLTKWDLLAWARESMSRENGKRNSS